MSKIHLPEIPDIPENLNYDLNEFLKAVKETLGVLTGRIGDDLDLVSMFEVTSKAAGVFPVTKLYIKDDVLQIEYDDGT